MKEREILIRDVAAALHVTPSAAGHYLAGRREPSEQQLVVIANMIGMSMSELIENDIRFARDDQERRILDLVRAAPEDQREHLERMIRAYIATLDADIDPPQA
jgi:transcriptional regulator with XRE-family HTH domain